MPSNRKYFIFSVILFAFAHQASAASIGVIAFVKGNVRLDKSLAKDGDELHPNSVIETNNGTCTLLIGESTVVHLGQNSNIEVQKYLKAQSQNEDIELNLKMGEVKALIGKNPNKEKNFRVRSRSHIMGVRGTEIFVSAPANPEMPPIFLTLQGTAEVVDISPQVAPAPAPTSEGSPTEIKQAPAAEPKPIVLTANQAFRPGENIQILTPERAVDISKTAGPPPPPDRPGQPLPPNGPPQDGVRPPPRIELPFGPGPNPLSGPLPLDPTIDRKQPLVPVQLQFDPD